MRRVVRFWLGDERREVAGVAPTTTLLDWLRGVEGRIGTKEGCNEGDCGACTVLLTRLRNGRIVHEPICARIRLLATVEDLARDGELHPVQRAMVEQHASQCGFCTPGFVTSLRALRLDHLEPPDEAEIEARLAGNLCRCTGYGPIVRAARAMYELEPAPAADPLLASAELWRTRLAFGGMAAIPARARATEAALEGAARDEAAIERAVAALARDFEPISDHRRSATYRRTVAANLLGRPWLESRGVPVRLGVVEPVLG